MMLDRVADMIDKETNDRGSRDFVVKLAPLVCDQVEDDLETVSRIGSLPMLDNYAIHGVSVEKDESLSALEFGGEATADAAPWRRVTQLAGVCEAHARERFDGDESFTSVTRWRDGDFRIEVRQGHGHEDDPYRQRIESVTYRRFDGKVIYADYTRFIDHRFKEYHEQKVLADRDADEVDDG